MRKLFLLNLFLSSSIITAQKVEFTNNMVEAQKATMELRYQDLDQRLKAERIQNPENRLADYTEGAALCIRMFLVEDEEFFEQNRDHLDQLISGLEDLSDEDPNKRVLLAELLLVRSGVYAKYKHNLKAAWGFYRAYNLLQENLEKFPNHIPTLVPYGVLQAAVGSLPSDYRSLAAVFGFKGDIERGLKMIRKAYYYSLANPEYRFYRDYFGYIYAFINFELETKEQVSLFTLGIEVERSAYFIYLEAQQELKQGRAAEALRLLQAIPNSPAHLKVPYFTYYQGKVALMVKPSLAKAYLDTFLKETKDQEHRKSTYRYLAWYNLLEGNQDQAKAYRQMILSDESAPSGADKQAVAEAKRGFNKGLIQARLDFDAGRYAEIVKRLSPWMLSEQCREDWEKQEFHYRRGRALQELKFYKKAEVEFLKVISFQDNVTYALGNSYLQLGYIYEQAGAYGSSRKYLKKAESLSGYAFHEGVQQKAKAVLARLP